MTTPSDSQPASVDVGDLWCLHVLGPDDVFPAPDRATAQRWAAQWTVWNQNRNPAPDALEPVMSWIVARWPHDAESHAAGVAASVEGNTFPVDPLASPAPARCDRPAISEQVGEGYTVAHALQFQGLLDDVPETWRSHGYKSEAEEIADMANVGRALMEALPEGYSYMNCPSEIVSGLQNERDEALALAQPAASGWRTMESAPRQIEFRCLLAHEFSIVTGYWDGSGWKNERSRSGGYFVPTHWMPLPAAPEPKL